MLKAILYQTFTDMKLNYVFKCDFRVLIKLFEFLIYDLTSFN